MFSIQDPSLRHVSFHVFRILKSNLVLLLTMIIRDPEQLFVSIHYSLKFLKVT